jgi:choline-sulfatase
MQPSKNLIFFQSDNHSRLYLGCYGNPIVKTPNLDKLAARGVIFKNAYAASALCCPARAAIACGRYPHQTGYWDNAIVYDGTSTSWMKRVRDQGVNITNIGKLHYRSTEDDNGFSQEIVPMHILNGKGGVSMLLRGIDDEPENVGQRELYTKKSGIGQTEYQDFDKVISDKAINWLKNDRPAKDPWALHVSFVSPHPPFSVPERLWNLYPLDEMPLPPASLPETHPHHPAVDHLRKTMRWGDLSELELQKIVAGYMALITHMDEQLGRVLDVAEDLGLLEDTLILYTSDHGEMAGSHGLLGKCNLYEGSIGVPLIMAGPNIPAGNVITENVSHVDLFPTLIEALSKEFRDEDNDLPGRSLWPAINGNNRHRQVFAEYHAAGSFAGGFMLRVGDLKLIYHTEMEPQLFDLDSDPDELNDLAGNTEHRKILDQMIADLSLICDPETVNSQAKGDQRAMLEKWGGAEAVRAEGMLVYTPPPGATADIQGKLV